jgi:GDPmannose 4,6-dehydratase
VPDLPRTALITGVAGQDGTYLAELLISQGVEVHGTVRSRDRADHAARALPGVRLHLADLLSDEQVDAVMTAVAPQEVYNLAGSTSVAQSWQDPVASADVMGVGAVRVLESAWRLQERTGEPVHVLQASSAEIFGDPQHAPQNEDTPLQPVTPYGAAKAFAHHMAGVYRSRGLFAVSAILYNHESPRRPETFVARKISRGVAEIATGRRSELVLGNTAVTRDWGYAPDFVTAMCRVLRTEVPADFVVATGEAHSVEDFVRAAFAVIGIDDHERYVRTDAALRRPADPRALVGDATRLRTLGWAPSLDFRALVTLLVEADLERLTSRASPWRSATPT